MTNDEFNNLKSSLMMKTPLEWQMDPSPHYFVLKLGPETDPGKAITMLINEYEEICAKAKVKMYSEIYNILKKTDSI